MSDNQYTTGEGYLGYQTQVGPTGDILGTPVYQQAGNILVNGVPTGKSAAGNAYAARLKFQAQAQVVAAVPETPASGVSVPAMSPGGLPDNSTTPTTGGYVYTHVAGSPGDPSNNVAAGTSGTATTQGLGSIYNWTPERYMA
jgi:hypothetical protein